MKRETSKSSDVWHALKLVCFQFLTLGLILGSAYFLNRFLPIGEWLANVPYRVKEMGILGGALFPFLFAACNILLLPGGIFSLGAGYCFGLWWGFTLSMAGTLFGAAGAFLMARWWVRGIVERRILCNPKWLALDRAVDREGWRIVILSQLNPLFPTSLIDYIYGVTGISFWRCMAGVAIGQAPGLFLYAYVGTLGQLGVKILRGENQPGPEEYLIWLGGLVASFVLTFLLGLVAARIWREHGSPAVAQRDPDLVAAPE